jgi:hypothetical protein
MRIISEMVNRSKNNRPATQGSNPALDATRNGLDLNETSTHAVEAEFEFATAAPARLNQTLEWDVQDLLPGGFLKDMESKRIRLKGIVQFILARRPKNHQAGWEFFDREILSNLILSVQMECARLGGTTALAFAYANMWGGVPVLGLNSSLIRDLQNFRDLIGSHIDPEYEYLSFPRAGLINKVAITLLPPEIKQLPINLLGRNLMTLNSDVLKGGVRPIKQKIFKDSDRDRFGNSLGGARLVQLEGTADFIASLSKLSWNYRFRLGIGTITIRSEGRFPPSSNTAGRGRGRNPDTPWRMGRNNNNNNRNFPPLGRGRGNVWANPIPGPSRRRINNNNNNNDGSDDSAVRVLHHVANEDLSSIHLAEEARRTLANQSSGMTVSQMVENIRGNGTQQAGTGTGTTAGTVPGAPTAPN